ncbi:hypothetical protein PanWU01x14_280070, partial [Parasponia andersonii]
DMNKERKGIQIVRKETNLDRSNDLLLHSVQSLDCSLSAERRARQDRPREKHYVQGRHSVVVIIIDNIGTESLPLPKVLSQMRVLLSDPQNLAMNQPTQPPHRPRRLHLL